MRGRATLRRSALALALRASVALCAVAGLACQTVDLMEPPADINTCRPSQMYYALGTTADGGMTPSVWDGVLNQDYGGKHCHDSACHGAGSKNSLKLTVPTSAPTFPLTMEWAANYRATAEQMNCANVRSSRLLALPSGLQTHGGGKLFEPNGMEADIIIGWVGAAP